MVSPWSDPRVSTAGLVMGNLVPLVGVVALGWEVQSLLVGYWVESGVIGAVSVAKILRAEGEDPRDSMLREAERALSDAGGDAERNPVEWVRRILSSNWVVTLAFLPYYGIFWVVHGTFVFAFALVEPSLTPASPPTVVAMAAGLVGYHVVSYRVDYIGSREYERTGPRSLLSTPYRRVVVLHATVVVGGIAVIEFGAPALAVAVLVLVKTGLDLRRHRQEHGQPVGESA